MRSLAALTAAMALLPSLTQAYPLYGSEAVDIRRLEVTRYAQEGHIRGRKRLPGELLTREQVDLRLLDHGDLALPPADPDFTRQIVELLGEDAEHYSISVLDLTNLSAPRYAEHNGHVRNSPGSVGKLAAAVGLFQAAADRYPDDTDRRIQALRDTWVAADEFIVHDHHKVRLWERDKRTLSIRPLQIGDRGTLWDYLDWMMSASSNAAAAMVMQQAMLMRHYGENYPVSTEEAKRFFAETPRRELTRLFVETFQTPLARSGIDLERFRQGSFFTRVGKLKVPGNGSHATSRELMRYLLKLEQGKLVDVFTSREIKRLLYVTERRIRYASSHALNDAAVYFKSGSLYSCKPEPGFRCRKYRGNKKNLMNSVAIVESPAGSPRLYYMVTLTSNVLRKNSAVEHQTLATRIQRLLERIHAAE